MSRSRSFSIYLLKEDFDFSNALKDDHALIDHFEAESLPEGARLFVLDGIPRVPWWAEYFGLGDRLKQISKGALIFLPVSSRVFALCFGHVSHNLKDYSYEYDFGIKTTLNSLNPDELKSTDVFEPSMSRRRRTQLPAGSDLTIFDFDRDSTILKSMTGAVKNSHKEIFRHATGASNLRISSNVSSNELVSLVEKIYQIYNSDDFKIEFPDMQNIVPVKDPTLLSELNINLVDAIRNSDPALYLTVPDIVNYHEDVLSNFSGGGRKQDSYYDVSIENYYDYLSKNEFDLNVLSVESIQKHQLVLTDENGTPKDKYSIFKSLVFDVALTGCFAGSYHFTEGNWYRVDTDYIERLKAFLDPYFVKLELPDYDHATEGAYNEAVAIELEDFICLDKKDISPAGQKQIEPCDLFKVFDGFAVFYHIKVSTFSDQLSHLFNQGSNSIEILKLEAGSAAKLGALLQDSIGDAAIDSMSIVSSGKCRVVYGVVTHKDSDLKSDNLPLFSRISLMRNFKALKLMNVDASIGFISDKTDKKKSTRKGRRRPSNSVAKSPGDSLGSDD